MDNNIEVNVHEYLSSLIMCTKSLPEALRAIALNQEFQDYFRKNKLLYDLLLNSAKRYIGGETSIEVVPKIAALNQLGYNISLEYMGGEGCNDASICDDNTNDIVKSINLLQEVTGMANVCLDLSTIGLDIDAAVCKNNLQTILDEADKKNVNVIISMEQVESVSKILKIYRIFQQNYENLGITLQAYMKNIQRDLALLMPHLQIVRIVKGVYYPKKGYSSHRSPRLDRKYLDLITKIAQQNNTKILVATQDQNIIDAIIRNPTLSSDKLIFEMLHGVQPQILQQLKANGLNTCIYLTYGKEWLIHLCHRIAEYPPNMLLALIDLLFKQQITHPY